jgi:hypothetical protein
LDTGNGWIAEAAQSSCIGERSSFRRQSSNAVFPSSADGQHIHVIAMNFADRQDAGS